MTKGNEKWRFKSPRSTALAVVVVTAFLATAGTLGYTVYANHSTISSLKSELSEKDKMITSKDNLIHDTNKVVEKQKALIQSQTKQIESAQDKYEDSQKEVEEQTKEVASLNKKLAAKVEAENQARIVNVSAKSSSIAPTNLVAKGGFQSGWKASFYNLGVASTGKRPGDTGYGITASGRPTSDVTISVDPRYIPLGTWVELKFPDGSIIKKRADDTGSAIKGKKIDVFMNQSDSTLRKKGVQKIEVRILGKGTSS
jgi:3D (Asp-Asp-Asp) domain-containing protein